MSDDGIEFGDVEQQLPERMLRPDRDPRLVCVPVATPGDEDLPIFVDLDAMMDVERHAASDTSVELGGVLLGGRYVDDDGRPFVVVCDTLRAEHYEATKGSFKFTHETWEAISRRRDAYPDDVRMVGWYHTHPDWGVFLSGMDLFICQNFFAHPQDLALVVDPCRDDRGWFQWVAGRDQPRRTGGFRLFASRHRRDELEDLSRQLEGGRTMPADTRYAGTPPVGFAPQPQILRVSDPRIGPGEAVIVVALLMQTLMLGLIAWRLLDDSRGESTPIVAGAPANSNDERLAVISEARQRVIEELLREQPNAETIAQKLSEQESRIVALERDKGGLEAAAASLAKDYHDTIEDRDRKDKQLDGLYQRVRDAEVNVERLTKQLAEAETTNADFRSKERAAWVWYVDPIFLSVVGATAVLAGIIGFVGAGDFYRRRAAAATRAQLDRTWRSEGERDDD